MPMIKFSIIGLSAKPQASVRFDMIARMAVESMPVWPTTTGMNCIQRKAVKVERMKGASAGSTGRFGFFTIPATHLLAHLTMQ
jgi:hypothetical protein